MDADSLKKLAVAGAIIYGAYKYGNPMVKAGAIAVAAVVVARRVPYVSVVL